MSSEAAFIETTTDPAKTEVASVPSSAFSMSESLAIGLVNRMVNEYATHHQEYLASAAKEARKEKITTIPKKRCVAYRFMARRSIMMIPDGHIVLIHKQGIQDGTDKTSKLAIIHWQALETSKRLILLITYLAPGWKIAKRWLLFELSAHALKRLFYRLKSLDQAPILEELNPAVRAICCWYSFIIKLIYSSHDALSIGVPTANGILYFYKSEQTAAHSPASLIASTWVSDTRMEDRPKKVEIVRKARAEGGFVMQFRLNLVCISQIHDLQELSAEFEPYNFPFFDDMLTFLPEMKIDKSICHFPRDRE